MRNTLQKKLILEIINNSFKHPTAKEIYEECKKIVPNISLGTVYRNLNLLEDKFQVTRIKMTNNIDRYDKVYNKHAHFICIKCNEITDLEELEENYSNKFKKVNDYKVLNYEINFKGICNKCLEKEYK